MGEQGFGRTIAVLAVFGCIEVSLSQRCESAGYTVITDPYRSTNATYGYPLYKAICDTSIAEDLWYRFDSYVGNTIPEKAKNDSVRRYKCGTLEPVFIVGLNSHPTEFCQDLDLAFLIDTSGSICESDLNFDFTRDSTCNNWNFIVEFVYRIIDSLVIGPSNTRVAMAVFSSSARLLFNLTAYTDKSSLLSAVNTNLVYVGGTTNTTDGLTLLINKIFTPGNSRPNFGKTAIIITDGRPTDKNGDPTDNTTVRAAIDAVHGAQVTTLVVGVTDRVDTGTLKLLSSSPQQAGVTYFRATDFSTIDQLREQLRNQICSLPPLQSTATSPVISIGVSTTASQPNSQTDCNVIMDVCLVVDRSGSICDNDRDFVFQRDETCNNWKYLVHFIRGLVNSFNIGLNNVRVALVTFSSSAEVGWGLNNYTDKASLLTAINGLAYIKGGTGDTTAGLNLVNTLIFNAGNDRTNAAKLAIIFTDGKPTVPSTVDAAVQAVHASNIKTMCVGVTNSIDEPTLKALSSPPKELGMTYFMAADFSTIDVISNSLQQQVCAIGSATTSGPDSQTNESEDKSLIAAVVLGIAVLLLLVVAIVEFVLLRKKKNSATRDVNYDYIDAVIRTGADPAKDQDYELTQRKRSPDVDQGGAVATSGHKDVPPIPPMYDRITSQTYDTEIHAEGKNQSNVQTYDTEIPTEDRRSQPYTQTCDTEIPLHKEDKSQTYLALYE